MLNGITWGQFTIFILVVTGVYYIYVFGRYYAAEIFGRIKYTAFKSAEDSALEKVPDNKEVADEPVPAAAEKQTKLLPGKANQVERPKPDAGVGRGDEQPQLVLQAIATIRQVIAQGIENKLDQENLLDHVREVLANYRKLRKTEHAETINNFLIRICSTDLSLELGEKELAELWK